MNLTEVLGDSYKEGMAAEEITENLEGDLSKLPETVSKRRFLRSAVHSWSPRRRRSKTPQRPNSTRSPPPFTPEAGKAGRIPKISSESSSEKSAQSVLKNYGIGGIQIEV